MDKDQEHEELRELLRSWDLVELTPHLQNEAINVDELKMMKQYHVYELLSDFPMGTRIRFEHHLERWRRRLNVPLQGVQWSVVSRPHCHGCRCATTQPQSDCARDSVKSDVTLTERHSPRESVQDDMQPNLEPVQILTTLLDDNEHVLGEDRAVTVLGILQADCIRSQSLLELVGQQKALSAEQRQLLIQMICRYYEDRQLHLSLNRSYQLESEILQLYPKERLEHYRTEKRGKIYGRLSNAKNKRGRSSHKAGG